MLVDLDDVMDKICMMCVSSVRDYTARNYSCADCELEKELRDLVHPQSDIDNN